MQEFLRLPLIILMDDYELLIVYLIEHLYSSLLSVSLEIEILAEVFEFDKDGRRRFEAVYFVLPDLHLLVDVVGHEVLLFGEEGASVADLVEN